MSDPAVPIVCDMTTAPDTTDERLAAYQQLFGADLLSRERTDDGGVLFHFTKADGLADRIRDLAAREKACCAFFIFDVTEHDDEITWYANVIDDPLARQILDEYYNLPDTATDDPADLFERFADQGLRIVTGDDGVMRPATDADLGTTVRLPATRSRRRRGGRSLR